MAEAPSPFLSYTKGHDPYKLARGVRGAHLCPAGDSFHIWVAEKDGKSFAKKGTNVHPQLHQLDSLAKEYMAYNELTWPHIPKPLALYLIVTEQRRESRGAYLVLPWLGDSLQSGEVAFCPAEHVPTIALCLLRTLRYVHAKNYTHHDIKPANIMRQGSKVFLIDFEFATRFSPGEKSSTAVPGHTDWYAPPERMARSHRKFDVFSMGLTLVDIFMRYFPKGHASELRKLRKWRVNEQRFRAWTPTSLQLILEATGKIFPANVQAAIACMICYNWQERCTAEEAYRSFEAIFGEHKCECRKLCLPSTEQKERLARLAAPPPAAASPQALHLPPAPEQAPDGQ